MSCCLQVVESSENVDDTILSWFADRAWHASAGSEVHNHIHAGCGSVSQILVQHVADNDFQLYAVISVVTNTIRPAGAVADWRQRFLVDDDTTADIPEMVDMADRKVVDNSDPVAWTPGEAAN